MRVVIVNLAALLLSQTVFASTKIITVRGSGFYSGLCNGTNGYFCIDDIRRAAERDSEWSADSTCRSYNGRLRYWANYCSSWCSPSSLPPNADLTSVNCRADCSYDCEVEEN
jgi:hypothetical protein